MGAIICSHTCFVVVGGDEQIILKPLAIIAIAIYSYKTASTININIAIATYIPCMSVSLF